MPLTAKISKERKHCHRRSGEDGEFSNELAGSASTGKVCCFAGRHAGNIGRASGTPVRSDNESLCQNVPKP